MESSNWWNPLQRKIAFKLAQYQAAKGVANALESGESLLSLGMIQNRRKFMRALEDIIYFGRNPNAQKVAGAVRKTDGSGAVFFEYQDVVGPFPRELEIVNQRLRQANIILTNETRRLRALNPSTLSDNDALRLRTLGNRSCAEAGIRLDQAAGGVNPSPINLLDNLDQMTPRGFMGGQGLMLAHL